MPESAPCRLNKHVLFLFLLNLVLVVCVFYHYNGTVMKKFADLKATTVEFIEGREYRASPRLAIPVGSVVAKQAEDVHITPKDQLEKMTLIELYHMHQRMVTVPSALCNRRTRYGNVNDGGWDVCHSGAYEVKSPCLVYSMGINWDFSFDDSISSQLGCKVHAFDPSMKTKSFNRSNLVAFHNYGIKGEKLNPNEQQTVPQTAFLLKNFEEILTSLNHKEKTIDYFKMDVEGPEWASLDLMMSKNLMSHIRQFAFEEHVFGFEFTKERFIYAIGILERLRVAGFEMYLSHENPYGMYDNKVLKKRISCCYEIYFVNTKYSPGKDD